MPVLLFGREYWEKIIDFQAMVEEGVIAPADIEIFQYVETAEEAWEILKPVIEAVAAGGRVGAAARPRRARQRASGQGERRLMLCWSVAK